MSNARRRKRRENGTGAKKNPSPQPPPRSGEGELKEGPPAVFASLAMPLPGHIPPEAPLLAPPLRFGEGGRGEGLRQNNRRCRSWLSSFASRRCGELTG